MRVVPRVLLVGFLAFEGLYVAMARLGDLRQRADLFLSYFGAAFVMYLGVVWAARRVAAQAVPVSRWWLLGLFAGAVVFRLTLVGLTPTLSDDIYRYRWDGRVQQAGLNPYQYAPNDEALAWLRDEAWAPINHKDIRTIYPPLMQLAFRLGAWLSPTVSMQKVAFLVCDMLIIGLLMWQLPRWGVSPLMSLVYAWHPLVVVEVAGSGHNDPLGVLWLLAGLALWTGRQRLLGTIAFALACLSKLTTVLLWPFYWARARGLWWLFVAAVVVGYLPFAGVNLTPGGGHYSASWEFNSSLYRLILGMVGHPLIARILCVCGVIASGIILARRTHDLLRYTLGIFQISVLLTPVLEPWYLLWLIPLLCARFSWGWLGFSGLAALSYVVLIRFIQAGVWHLPTWVKWIEYGPLYTWLLVRAWGFVRGRPALSRQPSVVVG